MTVRRRIEALEAALGGRKRSCVLFIHIEPGGARSTPTCPLGHILSPELRECERCAVPPFKRRRLMFHHIPAERRERGRGE